MSRIKLIEIVDMPTYAPCYLEYGECESEEDMKVIDEWLKGYSDSYENLTFEYGEEEYFSNSPEFGLPCTCVETKIYGVKK